MPKGKNEKVIGLMKDESSGKIRKEFVQWRRKTYSYLIDDGSEDKGAKGTKNCVIKRKLKIENYSSCLEATQLENKINHLKKIETDVDSPKKVHKEFIKNSKLISKIQQIFKRNRHNAFTEEINKSAKFKL